MCKIYSTIAYSEGHSASPVDKRGARKKLQKHNMSFIRGHGGLAPARAQACLFGCTSLSLHVTSTWGVLE